MSTKLTKLEKLITEANVEVRRVHDRLRQAEASNLQEAIRPLRKKFRIASEEKQSLEYLLNPSEEPMRRLLEHTADSRKFADSLEARHPAKAKTIRQKISALEKRYLLWCDHHGKAPTLLEASKPKAITPVPPPPPPAQSEKRGRGGKRDGAGRPALGHVQLLFKCSPTTAVKARKLAKAKSLTLGGWLDAVIDSLQ